MLWRSPLLSQSMDGIIPEGQAQGLQLTEHTVTVRDHCCNLICAGLHWEPLSQSWLLSCKEALIKQQS